MAYMNIGDPIQENFQRADRVKPNKNKRRVWKRQKRRKLEEAKRSRVSKIKPKTRKGK